MSFHYIYADPSLMNVDFYFVNELQVKVFMEQNIYFAGRLKLFPY
jgi:hypothetical protein